MKAVSAVGAFTKGKGVHCGRCVPQGSWTALGVLGRQRHAVKRSHNQLQSIERFSSSRSHPEETKEKAEKPARVRFIENIRDE